MLSSFRYGKNQDDLDKDDEAEATRSKKRPTAEAVDKVRMPAAGLGSRNAEKDKARADIAKAVAAYKKKGGKVTKIKSRDRTDRERGVAQRSHFGQGPGIMGHGTGKTSPKRAHEETLAVSDVHIQEKDSRRTVDAIRAYYRSKDASRDATYDTDKGKKGKGDTEKKYAKKERGEIKKDDPNWKHKKYHTGMHGEAHEIGTDEYAKYTKSMTPGQDEKKGIDKAEAKKNDFVQRAANYIKHQQATKIDDDYQVDEVKDRAELDRQIAAYKAKGGKITKLAPKHPKQASTTPARATGKVHQTKPSLRQLSKLK